MGKIRDLGLHHTLNDLRERLASGELAEDDPELPARFAQMAEAVGGLLLDMLAGDSSPKAEAMRKEIEAGRAALAALKAN